MLLLCAAGLTAVTMQVRCVDAARELARLAARGESAQLWPSTAVPAGAAVDIRRQGGYVTARVAGRSALLPGIVIAGEATAAAEPAR